jgi:hypothetical protein
MNVHVEQFDGHNGAVKNQFIIKSINGVYFQSYNSVIAFKPNDRSQKIQLDKTYWNYSKTTGKYRNQFLNEPKKETEQKIASGIYELVNLN